MFKAPGTNVLMFYQTVPLLCSAFLLCSCMGPIPMRIDDRISYETLRQIRSDHVCQLPYVSELNHSSKTLIVTKGPKGPIDGFNGFGEGLVFKIGKVLDAYFFQVQDVMFRNNTTIESGSQKIQVNIRAFEFEYTLSFYEILMRSDRVIDWVKISLVLELELPNKEKPFVINVAREVDLSIEELAGMSDDTQAVSMVLDQIVLDYFFVLRKTVVTERC